MVKTDVASRLKFSGGKWIEQMFGMKWGDGKIEQMFNIMERWKNNKNATHIQNYIIIFNSTKIIQALFILIMKG